MRNWAEMSKVEKSLRVGFAASLAGRLAECARDENVFGAAICGLSAVAALGLEPEEIRTVLKLLERSSGPDD